jgi:hypothetical protein
MKAADVYKRLKGHFGAWTKMHGFSPLERGVSWSRPHGSVALIFGFGVARRDYWDQFAGSQFVLDFQIGRPGNDDLKNRCFRFCYLLTDAQREELRLIQNRVINSLTAPPYDHERVRDLDTETRDWYLEKFVPVPSINPKHDTWMRYYTAEHVDEWAHYLLRQMPHFLNELETRK